MAAELQTVPDVLRKLQNGFVPAVRDVAQTGANLLTVRSAYFKAFDVHLEGLLGLAHTGTNTSEEASRYSAELKEVAEIMHKVNREDEKLFESFAHLIAAVTKFSETEKDRLKELHACYTKEEKTIMKNSKRTGDRAELQEFYVQELRKVKEQHAQRYAYFAKNYLELLRKYAEGAKHSLEAAEKQLLELDAADAVKRLDEVVKQNDTIKSAGLSDETLERVDSAIRRVSVAEVVIQPVEVVRSRQNMEDQSIQTAISPHRASKVVASIQTVDDVPLVESRPTTAASRVSSRPELPSFEDEGHVEKTTLYGAQGSPAAPPRKVLPSNIYRPTPILGLSQHNLDDESDLPKIPRPAANGFNRAQLHVPYSESRPDYIADIRPPAQPERRFEETRPPPPQYVKPAAVAEKPAFAVSDYGRTLECIQAHIAQGDHQLSMEVGDRMQLVKSGNRGWVLGRTSDSRQGWFPAKFLRIL